MIGSSESPQRFCKKCLLSELDAGEYFKSIYEYIDSISPEQKANATEYIGRLEVCKSCDNLTNGMCRLCGCFVEVRAAVGKNYCPDIKSDRWKKNGTVF